MTILRCQRWRDRRDSYRPAGEPIETRRYEVAEIADDNTAKAFVAAHHYSGTYPAARFRFGLCEGPELVGVAVFSVPARDQVITNWFPGIDVAEGVELGRFVLLDRVPANGETWFLARCRRLLRLKGIAGIVSFSDPAPRTTLDGRRVFAGHLGTIYQASNAIHAGRGRADTIRILPDATVFARRSLTKIRQRRRGWRYAAAQLEAHGADPVWDDAGAWLDYWLPRLTRSMRHPGNLRYLWALDRRLARHLPSSLPYPKQEAIAA